MSSQKQSDKFKPATNCKSDRHEFTVTRWRIGGGNHTAVNVRCIYCLMPVELERLVMEELNQ